MHLNLDSLSRNTLLIVSAVLMFLSLYLIFLWVPTELNLGVSQRIFYFHVPLGWLGMLSIGIVALASIIHLVTGHEKWDSLAYSAAELGVVFATLIIVTGAIWAKPVWGVWWTWDAKLTTPLILWFIYVGYLMLRAYSPDGSLGSRYGAVVALIGAIDAPIIYLTTIWWRGAHPDNNVPHDLDERMVLVFLVTLIAFTAVYACLLVERYSLRRTEAFLDEMFQKAT